MLCKEILKTKKYIQSSLLPFGFAILESSFEDGKSGGLSSSLLGVGDGEMGGSGFGLNAINN